jgi:hypothetical protein
MEKISKEIIVYKNEIGKICFLPGDNYIKILENQIIRSVKKLSGFYSINIPYINIELIYSRKELNNKLKRKTPNWLIGVNYKNKIYLFSSSVVERYSSHKKSRLNKIITHEICHAFNSKINKKMPTWLDEGIALYLSNQKKKRDFKKSDWQFFVNNINKKINLNSLTEHDGYKVSYWMVKGLTDNYNKKNLLKLIKKSSLLKREDLLP